MRILLFFLVLLHSTHLFAQNYYVQITGDRETRVADICGTSTINKFQLIAYNVVQNNGDIGCGVIGVDASFSLLFSKQYSLLGYGLRVIKIMPVENPSNIYILASKISLITGKIVAPIVIVYDLNQNAMISSFELPQLPNGYSFEGVYDIEENKFTNQLRVLCTGVTVNGNPDVDIFEGYVDPGFSVCRYKRYSPIVEFTEIDFISFVRNYHESVEINGETSIYGMARQSGLRKGFIIYRGINQLSYDFELYQLSQAQDLGGFIVNGNSPGTSSDFTFTMILTAGESISHPFFAIQQKASLITTNWQRFYQASDGGNFNVSRGRGGHGVKGIKIDYFPGYTFNSNNHPGVTILRYDPTNGQIYDSPEYQFLSTDLKIGYPNFCRYSEYFFLADRYVPQNGFKIGVGDTNQDFVDCTNQIEFREMTGILFENLQNLSVDSYNWETVSGILVEEDPVQALLIPECDIEHRDNKLIVKVL